MMGNKMPIADAQKVQSEKFNQKIEKLKQDCQVKSQQAFDSQREEIQKIKTKTKEFYSKTFNKHDSDDELEKKMATEPQQTSQRKVKFFDAPPIKSSIVKSNSNSDL